MIAWITPASPTTRPKRRNMMTPRIVSVLGVKTPPKVPNLFGSDREEEAVVTSFELVSPRRHEVEPR